MPTKSSTEEIRALLKQGYAYSEVHDMTGHPKSEISRQGGALRELGFEPRKRTDEEEKRPGTGGELDNGIDGRVFYDD